MQNASSSALRRIHATVGVTASAVLLTTAVCSRDHEPGPKIIEPISPREAVLTAPGFHRYQRYDAEGMALLTAHGHPDPFACTDLFPNLESLAAFEEGTESPEAWLWTIHLADAYATCHVCPSTGELSTPYNPAAARQLYLLVQDMDHAERAENAIPCAADR